jgi:hypothetical protein
MSGGRVLSEASARSGLALVAAGAVCLLVCVGAICVSPAGAKVHLPRRECPNVGPPNTDVGLYKIITRRIRCGKARAILRRWYHDPSQKDSGPDGWRCAEVRRGRFEVRSYCHRNGHLIAFSRFLV